MKKILIFCLLIISICGIVTAESLDRETPFYKSGFGFEYNFSANSPIYGLTYQHWFDNNLGIQSTLSTIIDYYIFGAAEIQLQKLFIVDNLGKKGTSALYGWGGIALTSNGENLENFDFGKSLSLILSSGLCIEMTFDNHLSIPFRFGLACNFLNNPAFGVCLGTGIRYRY